MQDYIVMANLSKLKARLREEGHTEEGEDGSIIGTYFPMAHTPPARKDSNNGVRTISVVRTLDHEQAMALQGYKTDGIFYILGEVIRGEYVFSGDEQQETYEKFRKVGAHRELVPVLDEDGDIMLDGNNDVIKEPSSHSYMQGVFA